MNGFIPESRHDELSVCFFIARGNTGLEGFVMRMLGWVILRAIAKRVAA
jgi:hypothetical protein